MRSITKFEYKIRSTQSVNIFAIIVIKYECITRVTWLRLLIKLFKTAIRNWKLIKDFK